MQSFGLLTGIITLLIIGLGFPLVIQVERRLGELWWPYMLGMGILIVTASLFISNDWLCIITGVLGAALVWGSTELKAQALRARLGWFPSGFKKIQPPYKAIIEKWNAPRL